MTSIINQLEPNERALLYTAMLFFKNRSEQSLAESMLTPTTTALREFYKYTDNEAKALMNKLFAECFPEDLEFVKHFNTYWKNQHTDNNKISTAI